MSRREAQLLALTVGCAVSLMTTSTSRAGLYLVSACTESVGYVNNSWNAFDNNGTYIETHSACGQEPTHELSSSLSNLAVADVMGSGYPPVGVEASWRFTAPAGTTITEITGSDDLFKDTDNSWDVFLVSANHKVVGGQTCVVELKSSFYCEVAGLFQGSGLSTSSLSLGIACTENSFHNCPDGTTIHDVRAELDYATVTIDDPAAPTNVVGVSVPAGPQRGTVSVWGSATDATAGLGSISVVNDAGDVIGGPVSVGPCNYSLVTPCPTKAENLSIPIDTTKLPNGEDQIRVEATNAAHDEGFSSPYTIDVENSSPKHEGGGGSPSEGSKTGGLGGSNTSTGGSGGSSGSGSSTSTGGSTSVPIPVSIHLDKVRRTVTSLLISGHLQPALTGTVTLMLWYTGSRDLIRNLHLRVTNGRFRAHISLARRLRRRHLTVDISYPGAAGYLHTSRTQIVSPVGRLLR